MSADSPRRSSGGGSRGGMAIPAVVPPQAIIDRSILDSAIGFINEVTLSHQPPLDPKDTITWARFETSADVSDPRYGEDCEFEGNVAPPLLLILGYGFGVQIWAIPANGEAVEVLSWRHGIVTALRVLPTPLSIVADEENGRADEPVDVYGDKRPLIALVDGNSTSGSQPQFCAVNFISLKSGAQVKTIKFKNPVIDILANRSSVVITFHERIAVFDARTLEDRLSITTCYPSTGINPNPIALGPRWLAYAENRLLHTKRSAGGCDGDGVASYTATVLNASKSLVKGLRELGEQVAAGLTGTSGSAGNSKNTSFDSGCGTDAKQPGIVTIIDVKNPPKDYGTSGVLTPGTETIIAHFVAHLEALVALEFDNSGMLLITADRRGHDFHVFRIHPNPVGSSLAAVHHLYILHRGDTSAKVQNITLTMDSRWAAVSTLRGTTHVFPITPYGGTMGVRTHTSVHVVNKLSRFHRSAGISGEGRSNSPISHSESTTFSQSIQPYNNSTLPPFPRPTVVTPLAQLRQPFALGSPPGSASLAGVKSAATVTGSGQQRQRLSSLSDDSGKPLSVCAIFSKSRSWLLDPPNVAREAPHRKKRKAVDSLFIMAGHGALIQYDLCPKLASNVAKEKICDDTPIELKVEAKAQWNLGRRKEGSHEVLPPLSPENWLMKHRIPGMLADSIRQYDDADDKNEAWVAEVEILSHAGPHRRLWMGPQFVFKTYNIPSGSNLNHVDIEAVEIGTILPSSATSSEKLGHSSPLNMPLSAAGRSSAVPVLIESGSYSSIEQSPKLMDRFRHDHLDSDYSVAHGDTRLKEDLADAMRESPSATVSPKDAGGQICETGSGGSSDNVAFYDALTAEDDNGYEHSHLASAAALASVLPNISSYDNNSSYESLDLAKKPQGSIEKIVNPLGTVTTVTACLAAEVKTDILDEVVSQLAAEDTVIHENCDESLFRPVVAIFCDEKTLHQNEEEFRRNNKKYQPPEIMSNKLVVPVIPKDLNDEISKREKEKNSAIKNKLEISKTKPNEQKNLEEISLLKRKSKECKGTSNTKATTCIDKRDSGKTAQKEKFSIFKHEKQRIHLIDDVSTDSTTLLKEMSDELNMKYKTDTKKQPEISEDHRNKQTETVVGTLERAEKKIQVKDEINDFLEECKANDFRKVKMIAMKCESKPSSCTEQDKEENIIDTAKISNKNLDCKSVSKIKSTDSVPCTFERKEWTKTKVGDDNVESRTQPSAIKTLHSSIKSNTAIKENVTKAKDDVKSIKLDKNENQMSKHFNEKTKIKIEDDGARKAKITSNNEKILVTTNPFLCDKKDNFKSKSNYENVLDSLGDDSGKYFVESKTVESSTSTNETQGRTSNKHNCKEKYNVASNKTDVPTKKSEKRKEKDISCKEQQNVEHDTSANLESNLSIHETVNEKKSGCESPNPMNEITAQSLKTKSEDKMMKNDVNNEKQCSSSIKLIKATDQVDNFVQNDENKKRNSSETESEPQKLRTQRANNSSEKKGHEQNKPVEENAKIETKYDLLNSKANNKASTELNQDKSNEIKTAAPEIKGNSLTSNLPSPKKKTKETLKFEEKKESQDKKGNNMENKTKSRSDTNENESLESTPGAWLPANKIRKQLPSPVLTSTSAWKALSGADLINKNFNKFESESMKFPLLETANKRNICDKLLPEIPTPADIEKQANSDELSVLKTLDPLPPLPVLEPLQLMTQNSSSSLKDISLITFESPLLETPSLQRKITPTPRGFTEQNLILALCGSLHYENEQTEKPEVSPLFSSNQALEGTPLADYKSLMETDDPYMSLEQSSQDTNTTNTNTTNEKCFSSTNSSGSEEIVTMEEKKNTKKQKRKKQQQLKELITQNEESGQHEIDDEELRPLIAMTDSQLDPTPNNSQETLPLSVANIYSTTTDSEGPLPATTSDENILSISIPIVQNPHKIKTKKLEHKINLIAAIEAATSSSTSSAEESGVELGGRSSHENGETLISETNSMSISTVQLSIAATSQTPLGALKKKTKRRKR